MDDFYAYMRKPANERKKLTGVVYIFFKAFATACALEFKMEFFINMPYMGTYGADADKIFSLSFYNSGPLPVNGGFQIHGW